MLALSRQDVGKVGMVGQLLPTLCLDTANICISISAKVGMPIFDSYRDEWV